MSEVLEQLLDQQKIWRGKRAHSIEDTHISTGYAVLDKFLPGGGWPRAALTEVLVDAPGTGELQLVLPALVQLSTEGQFSLNGDALKGETKKDSKQKGTAAGRGSKSAALQDRQRWISWIAPPYVPYAPALSDAGINLARMLVVHAKEGLDAMWAAEQSLRCGTCAAVLVWVDKSDNRSLRRLQLAAEEGDSWGIVFRHSRVRTESSPAAVRLQLSSDAQGKTLHLLKSRGGRPLRVAAEFLNP